MCPVHVTTFGTKTANSSQDYPSEVADVHLVCAISNSPTLCQH